MSEKSSLNVLLGGRGIGKEANCPPRITMTATPTAITFHPEEDLLAVSTYDKDITVFSYSNNENESKAVVEHTAHCRDLKFGPDGLELYAAMSDQSLLIYDATSLSLEREITLPSLGIPSAMLVVDENVVVIGDDDGRVNFWDKRSNAKAMEFEVSSAPITSVLCDPNYRTLVTTCFDGILATVKIGGRKIHTKSEPYEDPLNCSGLAKQNTKLVVGDADGRHLIFNWGEFEYHNDIHTSNGRGINKMIPITEHIILSGCDDGTIKATHLFPYEIIGQIGDHNDMPVECMDVCNDGHLIATASIDKEVIFWNVEFLADFVPRPKTVKINKKKESKRHLPSSNRQNAVNFFDDL